MVLEKVCGEANKILFIGFTDLFQEIAGALIPDFWPMTIVEETFDNIFDALQEQMKPFAYKQGAAMGRNIENSVNAWIQSQFDEAMKQLNVVKNQALAEIAAAEKELKKQAAKIANLASRVAQLEGATGMPPILQKPVI